MTTILVPIGTRPETIKLAPVVGALRAAGFAVRTVATGQQDGPEMADDLYDELGFFPDDRWRLPADPEGRLGVMLTMAHREIGGFRPDAVVVLGDTHTVPLFSLAARAGGVAVVHVEAGLRSFNERSIEEVNRRTGAAIASLHFAPTAMAAGFLAREGVPSERVHVVGNAVIDVLMAMGVRPRPPDERSGIVFTAHRATNVDDPTRLAAIVSLLQRLARDVGPVTFPVHPRTELRLRQSGLGGVLAGTVGLELTPPLPYRRMLDLLAGCQLVVTDSGGLQEEASWFGVPVVVLRRSTPRWEGVIAGATVLTGLDEDAVVSAARRLLDSEEQARIAALPCLYGDGDAAERIASILLEPAIQGLLQLREPDFTGSTPPLP